MAEGYVIDRYLKPTLLKSMDPPQFDFIPGSSMTFAIMFMLYKW